MSLGMKNLREGKKLWLGLSHGIESYSVNCPEAKRETLITESHPCGKPPALFWAEQREEPGTRRKEGTFPQTERDSAPGSVRFLTPTSWLKEIPVLFGKDIWGLLQAHFVALGFFLPW